MRKNIKLARERIAAALRMIDSLDTTAENKEKLSKRDKAIAARVDARFAVEALQKAERSLLLIIRDANKEL